ncbi:MAG: tripartite tricarboxylate transporter TctB family protein [Deltaproteobacteria bacterium]|nr:tripartite tricarboxylate transporter TctB family protein [Deltaproteobacteria bacterium]
MSLMERLSQGWGLLLVIAAGLAALTLSGFLIRRSSVRKYFGEIMVPLSVMAVCILFVFITFSFPEEEAGPAVIPQLIAFFTVTFCMVLLYRVAQGLAKPDPPAGRTGFMLAVVGITAGYCFLIDIAGYFLSTFLFLLVLMYVLGYRRRAVILSVALGWVLFSYAIFYRFLHIQLPLGFWENFY